MEQAVEQRRLVPINPPGFKEAWVMVLGQLRMEMNRAEYETWVHPLVPVGLNEGVYRVGAINRYGREWVESHLRSKITGLLEAALGQPLSVRFILVSVSGEEFTQAESSGSSDTAVLELPAPLQAEKINGNGNGRKKRQPAEEPTGAEGSPRKIQLQRAYGSERARIIQPERGMFLTRYFFENWLPLLGHSGMATVLAARFLCYWNPMTGELRNVIETDMSEIARHASVSVRTVKDVLNNDLIKRYFLRYRVRRMMTPNGVRTAGILLQVRMDDPLTPEDQDLHQLAEIDHWFTADFEDDEEEE
jgi:hypothetical protein